MSTVGKLYSGTGILELLEGELNERLPAVTDGLTHHFPFDGSTNAVYDIENAHLSVLDYSYTYTSWNMKYHITNGNIATGTLSGDDTVSVAESLTYDMVVCDQFVWAINATHMSSLKDMADSGAVVWSTGNDTGANVFVGTIGAIGTEDTINGTLYYNLDSYIGDDLGGTTVIGGTTDPNYYLATFNSIDGQIIPLYYHDYVGSVGIMGYLYLPNNSNGGSLFFDMFGYMAGQSANWSWLKHLLTWQLNRKQVSSLILIDTNNTHSFSGVAIEAATTNLITSSDIYFPNYRPYSGTGHANEVIVVEDIPPVVDGIDVYRITDNALDTQNMRFSHRFDIIDKDIWDVNATFSFYVWLPEIFRDRYVSHSAWMYQNTNGTDWHGWKGWNATYSAWAAGNITLSSTPLDLLKTECWQKMSVTGKALEANRYNDFSTSGTGSPDNKFIAGALRINVTEGVSGSANPTPFFYYITAPQLEEKTYHTEFVDGSRAGDGYLKIEGLNIDTSTEDFTFSFKIKTNDFYSIAIANRILFNNFGWFRRYHPTDTTNNVKWVWDWVASVRNYQDLNSDILFSQTNFETITIAYDANGSTYGQVKVYRNGIFWEVDDGLSTDTRGIIDFIDITNLGVTIKDVSLFNKILSDEEILNLGKSAMSFTTDGDLIVNEVREEPSLPSSLYTKYFPFDNKGSDKYKVIDPDTELNTIYEDRSVWVGTETTNLLYNAGATPLADAVMIAGAGQKTYLGGGKYKLTSYGGGTFIWRCYCNLTDLTDGETYTSQISFEDALGTLTIDWCDTGSQSIYAESGTLHTTSSRSTYNSTYRFFDISIVSGGVITVFNDQVEHKPFPTPFVDGARSQTDLHLPYSVIDCKVDFTIFGFWYPKVYADSLYRPCITRNIPGSNLTNNRILVMNYNTVTNQLRAWVGSGGLGESSVYAPVEIPIIINEWNFFALVRDGADILLYIGNSSGFGSGTGAVAYRLDIDETGQVWKIGEYINGHESDAYHRDYGFEQSALSEEELNFIFNKGMSSYKDKLRISHEIREV